MTDKPENPPAYLERLRDEFAMAAIPQAISLSSNVDGTWNAASAAKVAYELAGEMIIEKKAIADALRRAIENPDHKPDGSGLDDGPPLPLKTINATKRERAIKLRSEGKTLRAIAAELGGVSFETIRVWTAGVSVPMLAARQGGGHD